MVNVLGYALMAFRAAESPRRSEFPNGLADGPKGQENSAQALAWVNIKRGLAL